MIRMADTLPGVIIGLAAGVWVDRLRRRPLMIWADIGRAVLLAWIPLAAVFGLLGIWQLFAVVIDTKLVAIRIGKAAIVLLLAARRVVSAWSRWSTPPVRAWVVTTVAHG